ncbi:MAG TPA: cation:proton antiporter family protein [Acidimicrobiia bacterium]|jgi:predicted Kef-type K+ transport protein
MTDIAIPLTTAFALGFAAQQIRLPPLVGYLIAGFALHALGFEPDPAIEQIADLGVLLLLFGIGLKLKLSTLARPVVWAGTSVHLLGSTALFAAMLAGLAAVGTPLAEELGFGEMAIIGFALAFSSTVFAVKALEQFGEGSSLAGTLAIAMLVMQDIFAVVFLVAVGSTPSWWAIPVVAAVILARPLYYWMLSRTGYEELFLLFGLVLAIGVGAGSFDAVGLKPDLGALIIGLTLAGHPKASDLSATLLGFKDILLIGFFLSIGLGGLPDASTLIVISVILLLLPVKTFGYLAVLSRFRLRGRTTWHASVTLANYSEFGLIVVAVVVDEGLLDPVWTVVIAVVVAASFAVAAPPNTLRYDLYRRLSGRLVRLERTPVHPDDALIDPGDATVMVFGMGRVGSGAYDELEVREIGGVLGVDRRADVVQRHVADGRRAVRGDALDSDFWERVRLHPGIELAVLAMNDHGANIEAIKRIRSYLPMISIAAVASHPDEVAELESWGVDVARNLYEEAGQGLADDAVNTLPELGRA